MNFVLLYGCALYLNFIQVENLHGLYLVSFIFFSLSLYHLSFGFTTTLFGYLTKHFSKVEEYHKSPKPINSKTAIVFPIFNEDSSSVYCRIKTMLEHSKINSILNYIDFYVLSDSNELSIILEEEMGFRELEKEFGVGENLFYRRRLQNINHKSGNIADFCKRFGDKYDFMIIMDADSYLSIELVETLIHKMEASPDIGIIQTYPEILFPKSMIQNFHYVNSLFSSELYVLGSQYWNINQGPYWGHNAILRMDAFLNYCLLPKLPKIGPLGEKILSHDTIEAALLRKAGYRTEFIYTKNGSYEESPPTLTDFLKRESRWLRGNLQHFWFLFVNNIGTINRIYILLGITSYFSYLFWFFYLISILGLSLNGSAIPNPLKHKELLVFVITILFLPRILSLHQYIKFSEKVDKNALKYYLLDTILTIFSSSIFLFSTTIFLFSTFMGRKIEWKAQNRKADNKKLDIPFLFHWITGSGIILGFLLWIKSFITFLYFSPILIGWIFSIPILLFLNSISLSKFSAENKEIETLKSYIDRNLFRYDGARILHPIYLLCKDPSYFYTHLSFLKKKKKSSQKFLDRVKRKVGELSRIDFTLLNERELKFLWNHREVLLEYRNLILQKETQFLKENDEIYNKTVLISNFRNLS